MLWAELECTAYVALPKCLTYQCKPVRLRRQQELRTYCPNAYTVTAGPSAFWQKPPYSYIALITMAISSKPDKKMTLNQVRMTQCSYTYVV